MKTNKLFYWPLMLAVLVSGLVSCYDDSDIVKRLEALETTAITSINEQITAIKASVTSLETVDKEVKSTIQKLEERASSLQGEIDKLKAEDTSLQEEINKLLETDIALQEEIAKLREADASLQEEISKLLEEDSALKGEIEKLKAEDTTLKAEIDKLIKEDSSIQEEIAKLKEADESLGKRIDELKTYVESEISNTKDWATVTFATLEQYDSLCVVLVDIKSSISDLKDEFNESLTNSIADSKTSMEEWVNKQLTGYWTIAETQVRLDSLKQTESEDIAKLSEELAKAKTKLTDAYTLAISKAIEESEGKLSDEITKINENLEKSINSIEERLTKIEETLSTLTREFAITFDDTEVGILAGGTTSVGYTITGATEKTTVKALGQNGWSAKVTPNGTDKGTITVTAPNPLTEDEIIVLVYDGEYRTIMSSINFVTGTVTPSQTAVELEAEAGTVDITVTSNLNYKVSIPEDAQDWLSVVETRATKTETVTFAYAENEGGIRNTTISLTDNSGNLCSNIVFIQQSGTLTDIKIKNAGTLIDFIDGPNISQIKALKLSGEINGDDITILRRMNNLKYIDLSDVSIIPGGGKYYNDYIVGEKETIPTYCFYGMKNLKECILPNNTTSIESYAFYNSGLEKINIPNSCVSIYYNAFSNTKLTNVIIPENVIPKKSYDRYAKTSETFVFVVCENLKSVVLPNNWTFIPYGYFAGCSSLTDIVIPEGIVDLQDECLSQCHSLKNVILPNSLEKIGDGVFSTTSIESITIPENVRELGASSFGSCDKLKEIHIKALPSTLSSIHTAAFGGTDKKDVIIYVPKGTKRDFQLTSIGDFQTIIEE